jgi:hypothetical protein
MTQTTRALPLAAALLLAGCAPIPEPEAPVQPGQVDGAYAIRTDRAEYQLRRAGEELRAEIGFTFRNETGRTVYVVNCRRIAPPSLEKWQGGRWVRAWTPAVPACLSPPIVIAAGATHADTLHFSAAPRGSSAFPQLEVDDPAGTYRLVWEHLVFDYDENRQGFGAPVPEQQRVSNPFVFRRPG